uniref:Glutathione peroxidase n=1 Tax=Chlamydomonas euryale TaxID=1486919 RepID=A0A7R9VAW9_9CHLO|mmetsp:Transcript_29659/g.87764  ORF Transcript_29659/g.87764 Transcript_29659/m.87764 type:complete len:200 (+) Transcript_29659:41-640(+)
MQSLASRNVVLRRPAAATRPAAASRARVTAPKALFGSSAPTKESFYDYEVKNIDGKLTKLSTFKGKVVLVVNLASACGFTPQYTELETLYKKYKNQGLVIAGFPCNQFGAQEPGSNAEIKRFAQSTYGATFPLFSKVNVNGADADPVFEFLKSQKGGLLNNDIKWNFSKFLVSKDGKVVGRYPSTTAPQQIEADILKLL